MSDLPTEYVPSASIPPYYNTSANITLLQAIITSHLDAEVLS